MQAIAVPALWAALAPSSAAAHGFAATDVVGGVDVSAGWSCRVEGAAPGPCADLALGTRRRVRVTLERTITPGAAAGPSPALSVGHFATPTRVSVDGRRAGRFGPGLVLLPRPALRPEGSRVVVETTASSYRRRPAWDGVARVGPIGRRTTGWLVARGAGATGRPMLVHVPEGLDPARPAPLLVALHPWGVGPWAYVGAAIVPAAARAGFVVLAPDGLGNSLWVGQAETEALAAIDALAAAMSIDPDRVFLFGASMGGAGATTIGLRHPDRFAGVASFFGDSQYAVGTYTSAILPEQAAVDAASCARFVENARNLPVFLAHGQRDATTPVVQTTALAARLDELGFTHETVVREDRGHEQRLVDEETPRLLAFLAAHRRARTPLRVSLRASDASVRTAYWLTLEPRSGAGWAFADVQVDRATNAVRVLAADNIRRVVVRAAEAGLDPARPIDAPPEVRVDRSAGRGGAVD
jgi:predicted esterase